jgi:two-component system response regulator PilR (NtrC family)
MTSSSGKILVVDDNRKYLQNIALFLRSEGYQVDEAQGGDEAAQHLKQQNYDLVLSDLVMPGTNGFHLLEKKRHLAPHTPALIMSSFADINLRELMEIGAVDFISKPLELDELLTKVKRALEDRFEDASL